MGNSKSKEEHHREDGVYVIEIVGAKKLPNMDSEKKEGKRSNKISDKKDKDNHKK